MCSELKSAHHCDDDETTPSTCRCVSEMPWTLESTFLSLTFRKILPSFLTNSFATLPPPNLQSPTWTPRLEDNVRANAEESTVQKTCLIYLKPTLACQIRKWQHNESPLPYVHIVFTAATYMSSQLTRNRPHPPRPPSSKISASS